MYRHGDVLLIPRPEMEAPPAEVGAEAEAEVVVAEGEATGHAHRVVGRGARLDGRVLALPSGGEIRHEEHATIALPPGVYEVRRQRTWAQAADWRDVRD